MNPEFGTLKGNIFSAWHFIAQILNFYNLKLLQTSEPEANFTQSLNLRGFTTIFLVFSWLILEFNSLLWTSESSWSSFWFGAFAIGIFTCITKWPIHKSFGLNEFVSKSYKDGLNCLQFFIILGWNFPHWHIVKISKFSCFVWIDCSLMNKIAFVTNHKFRNWAALTINFSESIMIIFL